MSSPSGRKVNGSELSLVWFSEIQWDFLSTRKQRLLQRFPAEWRILFVEPFALGRRQHWLPVKRGRVTVVTVPFLKQVPAGMVPLFDFAPLRSFVSFAGSLVVAFWTRVLGFAGRDRLIGLSNIFWGGRAAAMRCRVRFYDANDDHLGFTGAPQWLRRYLRRYLDAADLLFHVSPELREMLHPPPGVRCVELGNGVDFEHFARPRAEAPPELAALPKPILGYAGALDWLDTDLLESVAKAWPACSVVLVGPAYARDWKERHAALLALPNVHAPGKVGYDELPAWVQRFDLALMPLERSDLKRASHPNKLYEYTAAGVPVLAIDYCSALGGQARQVVAVASTPEAFVRLVPEAMADQRRESRQAFAREHGWDAIASVMAGELRQAFERRRG
ncbi:MAG: glycosyltransferase family 1 protein [Chlorobiaceae bacterium]|nr:glycosyltransferase family 1 protein [Chlorobiaceae bacterium]NTW74814.1 glycosyltransferase family 1 protein [Chlorobiaceae bacterium]